MADVPIPRSYPQILGDLIDGFLSRQGLTNLRIGDPILSILECASQSDLRTSQDIFDLLNAISLDKATGLALDRIGADERVAKITETPASGVVDITDTTFVKVSTRLFQGQPAPIIGSPVLYVVDASLIPVPLSPAPPDIGSTVKVYLGRGTQNYEGPLTVTQKTQNTGYWTLTLSTPTVKFHNVGEGVILGQGGNRAITVGTIVRTPQANMADAVSFAVLYGATLPDGEDKLTGVIVVASLPGTTGNIPARAIKEFATAPFQGASVTNLLPYTNGLQTEDDDTYRERIKNVRKSRTQGTALAITTAVTGITSSDESKRVTSSSIVVRSGYPTTLYIDDGTGYEERSQGVPVERVEDEALGGEQFFATVNRPITKAFVTSQNSSPFALSIAAKLTVRVGGLVYTHQFSPDDFQAIESASAFDVASSINKNGALAFAARPVEAGTKVALFAKADSNEDIQVIIPATGINSNETFQFPSTLAYSLRLYQNDRLLSKDGRPAVLRSRRFSEWGVMSGSLDLVLSVDKTPDQTYTFTDQDFIDGGTGFVTTGRNSTQAWAAVLNAKLPGLTVTLEDDRLVLTSNAGTQSKSAIEVISGALVTSRMFTPELATGKGRDYTVDRNYGQLRLEAPLETGDRLTVGSNNTRSFIEGTVLGGSTTIALPALAWFSVDGGATIIQHGVSSIDTLTITSTGHVWGSEVQVTVSANDFYNVLPGDWCVIWGPDLAALAGIHRVTQVLDTASAVVFNTFNSVTATPTLGTNGLVFVRSTTPLQPVAIAAGTYTPGEIVTQLNAQLVNATASLYHGHLRVQTTSDAIGSDVALVAQNGEATTLLKLQPADAITSLQGLLGSVASGNVESGTPTFLDIPVLTHAAPGGPISTSLTVDSAFIPSVEGGYGLAGPGGTLTHLYSIVQGPLTLNLRKPGEWLPQATARFVNPFAIGPNDDLTVEIDGDPNKQFNIKMWRKLKPATDSYGVTNTFLDAEGTPAALSTGFGPTYDFNDFVVFMRARAIAYGADANRKLLIRYERFGGDGNGTVVRFDAQAGASKEVDVAILPATATSHPIIRLLLPTGAARTLPGVRAGTRVGKILVDATRDGVGLNHGYLALIVGFSIASAHRTGDTTQLTFNSPFGITGITVGLLPGDIVYINGIGGTFASGAFTLLTVDSTNPSPTGTFTVTYKDGVTGTASATSTGTLTCDHVGEILLNAAGVEVDDFVTLGPTTYVVTEIGPQYLKVKTGTEALPASTLGDHTVVWTHLLSPSGFTVAANPKDTVAAIITAVNSKAATDTKWPVTLKNLGTGTGILKEPTADWGLNPTEGFTLGDGINWVQETTVPTIPAPNYGLTFKQAPNGTLAIAGYWIDEEVRIAPVTAKGIAKWLNTASVSGLFTASDIETSLDGRKLQISTRTPGSTGSVQVQGGLANATTARVVAGGQFATTITKADATGLSSGMWCKIQNQLRVPKTSPITSATGLYWWFVDGNIRLNTPVFTKKIGDLAGGLITPLGLVAPLYVTWERQGKFIRVQGVTGILDFGANTVTEGDFLRTEVSLVDGGIGAPHIPIQNKGLHRIVRVDGNAVWIEDGGELEGTFECSIAVYTGDSLIPGDHLVMNTGVWGEGNRGDWVIETVGGFNPILNYGDNPQLFKVVSVPASQEQVNPVPTALGAAASSIQIIGGFPVTAYKRIKSITVNGAQPSMVDVTWDTLELLTQFSASAGAVISPIDKLGFTTDVNAGVDGYHYGVGLVGEANKVVYGDPSDPAAYPGVAAAGTQINIQGPLVRRVRIALNLRLRSGLPAAEIGDRVRSAVAAVINQAPIGKPIAISSVVAAASRVGGVVAVSVVSPLYSVSGDLIPVQPFERPLILNARDDISISFSGD